jgi:hypothetical protein
LGGLCSVATEYREVVWQIVALDDAVEERDEQRVAAVEPVTTALRPSVPAHAYLFFDFSPTQAQRLRLRRRGLFGSAAASG